MVVRGHPHVPNAEGAVELVQGGGAEAAVGRGAKRGAPEDVVSNPEAGIDARFGAGVLPQVQPAIGEEFQIRPELQPLLDEAAEPVLRVFAPRGPHPVAAGLEPFAELGREDSPDAGVLVHLLRGGNLPVTAREDA